MKKFHFGENLRIIRQAKGISQEAMALGLGMSQTHYSRFEKLASIPSPEMVEKICKILKVDPKLLLGGKGLEDLLPKYTFEEQANGLLHTKRGMFFYGILMLPFLDAAYYMGEGFCEGLGTSEEVKTYVSFFSGLAALIVAIYFFIRIRRGKD